MMESIDWGRVKSNKWLLAWLILGSATVLAPTMHWGIQRTVYYSKYGKYVAYEEKQRQYEEYYNQQQEQQNYNGNYNDDGNNYYSSSYKKCGWWNIPCNRKQESLAQLYFGENDNNNYNYNGYDENGNPVAPEQTIPVWYLLISGGSRGTQMSEARKKWEEENTGQRVEENDRREEEEMGKSTIGEALVAIYMVVALIATVVYGARRLYLLEPEDKETSRVLLRPVLTGIALLANLLFINLLLLPKLVSTDDRMLEGETIFGWSGQTGVLMALVDLWGLLFCAIFALAFYFGFYRTPKDGKEEIIETDTDVAYVAA